MQKVILKAFFGLGLRQILLLLISIVTGVYIARVFNPDVYGGFFLVILISNLAIALTDLGFSGFIIKKHNSIENKLLLSIMSTQQTISIALFILTLIAVGIINMWFELGSLLWAIPLAILPAFYYSRYSIIVARLEGNINFSKIAKIEVLQQLIYSISIILFGYLGYELLAICLALHLKFIMALCFYRSISEEPLPIISKLEICRDVVSAIPFSIQFQSSRIISLLKDSLNPIVVGMMIGLYSVGLLNWAQITAAYPLIFISVTRRIFYPAFCELSNEKEKLIKTITWSVILTNQIVAPLSIFILIFIDELILYVFGDVWFQAYDYFLMFWIANIFVATVTPLLAALEAVGLPKLVFRMTWIWLILNWVIGLPAIYFYGAIGVPVTNIIIQLSNFLLLYYVKRHINWNFSFKIVTIWFYQSVTGFTIYQVAQNFEVTSIWSMIGVMTISFIILMSVSVFTNFRVVKYYMRGFRNA